MVTGADAEKEDLRQAPSETIDAEIVRSWMSVVDYPAFDPLWFVVSNMERWLFFRHHSCGIIILPHR